MTGHDQGSTALPACSAWAGYAHATHVFDEAVEGHRLRPHWESIALRHLKPVELHALHKRAQHILREHETIRHRESHPDDSDHPSDLDPIPFILPANEWATLEQGLIQRTNLLNRLLADLYGPRRAITEGVLPATVVQANPAFLRPVVNMGLPVHLLLHAIDLERSPDGRWWAVADHCQAPRGLGLALQHRLIMSRLLPATLPGGGIASLDRFCQNIRQRLLAMDAQADASKCVLLADAPDHPCRPDQSYLAQHLGLALVEGEDLTVRGDSVFLKTLSGLQRVHVILRMVTDSQLDPLELNTTSTEGVPGLLEAARSGQVALINAPGNGLADSPALLAFLPGLCRFYLDEALRLPSVATWWCGQEAECEQVLNHMDRLTVRSAFPFMQSDAGQTVACSSRTRADMTSIKEAPHQFVGQEMVQLSCSPSLGPDGVVPRPIGLRVFVCSSPEGSMVLPGGLVRLRSRSDHAAEILHAQDTFKDVWILSENAGAPMHFPEQGQRAISRKQIDTELPSRVADNLFWLGRYIERLEDTARLLRCALIRLRVEQPNASVPEARCAARLLVRLDLLPHSVAQTTGLAALESELAALTQRHHRLGTVPDLTDRLRRIALIVRERFSADTWRIIKELRIDSKIAPRRTPAADALQTLNRVLFTLAAFSGMQLENMTRGPGWRFLDLGRRMERAVNMLTLSQAVLDLADAEDLIAELMLDIADSSMTYRRHYHGPPQLPAVLELLWLDAANPRSLLFQIETILAHMQHFLEGNATGANLPVLDKLRRQCTALRALRLSDLLQPGALQPTGRIPGELRDLVSELRLLSEFLTQRYFSHARIRCNTR